jgi:hypothetical protein
MEREGVESTIRVLRAIRSLAYNRRLKPLVEERIERAEATIRSHLMLQGTAEIQIGPYEVQANEQDEIRITRLSVDEWQQMPLSIGEEYCEPDDGLWPSRMQVITATRITDTESVE